MVVFPGAKINLGLNILRRLPSGFHEIETCMVPVEWSDVLEVVRSQSDQTILTQSGIQLDCAPDDNLIMKAQRLLATDYTLPPLDIYLEKCVPSGAGLGGGSADAAFTLRAINEICNLGITDTELAEYAARLGSDCPFFVYNRPMICTGTGIVMEPIAIPQIAGKWVLIVKPDVHISTAEAYRGTTPRVPDHSLREVLAQPIERWSELLHNDFEDSLSAKYPVIPQLKAVMYDAGALYSSLSGSGSAVYGIFESEESARAAKSAISGCRAAVVRLPLNQ
ncbi:MAG: 4-(cytidine 5'-diphospho)-2-C-methyl-D-erythritol kinase [Paramuribaculum sp.]|nr:4-(cytidine 5'-diphospho)-2-C-methyl-D-erythritol kinase [Paramuribaculum sp.]